MDTFVSKVVLIGNANAGKSSLRHRYLGGSFLSTYITTVGADFGIKRSPFEINGQVFELKNHIWDLSGQPHFNSVRPIFYTGCHGIIFVYDITARKSFEDFGVWFEEVKNHVQLDKQSIVIFGNKIDLKNSTPDIVTEEEALALAKKYSEKTFGDTESIKVLFTSALTGENVDEAFNYLGTQIIEKFLQKS